MIWIGMTGSIATGKTLVCNYLLEKGHIVIDADAIVHKLLETESPCYNSILAHFGTDFFDENKQILKKKLGDYVFSNRDKLKELEAIVHPEVKKETQRQKEALAARGADLVFHNIPLLYEKKLELNYDIVGLVYCTEEQQAERLRERHPELSQEQAFNRINAQISIEKKIKLTDFLIDNSKDIGNTFEQVDKFLLYIKSIR